MTVTTHSEAQAASAIVAVLLHPSTLILLASNALPLIGVLFCHWDAFLLLMLYWMETAIIGFWMIARVAASAAGTFGPLLINGRPSTSSPIAFAAFFVVHGGMFMGVHFLFLWLIFAGAWSRQIHGVHDFVDKIVIATGLWVPLLVLFAGRGAAFLFHLLRPESIVRLEQRLLMPTWLQPPIPTPADGGSIMGAFYVRVVIMQLAIIFGASLAGKLGTLAPLIIMVTLKTLVDLVMHAAFDLHPKSMVAAPAGSMPVR
jgi:hypothetical protein